LYEHHRVPFKYLKPCTVKGKAGPVQAWASPEGSRKLRLPDFVTNNGTGWW